MSPEIYLKKPFDGHAVDIWAGMFIILTSTGPNCDEVFS